MKLALALALLPLAACAQRTSPARTADASEAAGPLLVHAANRPLACFAERIGGDAVDVHVPAPSGVDPAFWKPAREDVAALQAADLVLLNGAGYEPWLAHASLPLAAQVDTSAAFADRLLRRSDTVAHKHGPEGDHTHGATAFTTWMDPELAKLQARAIQDALVRRLPAREAELRAGFDELAGELDRLDADLRAAFDDAGPLLASHPVYDYLQRAYGLDLRSVHWEPDEPPGDAGWGELRELLAQRPAACMLWEGEPLPETARRLGELGVAVAVLDPRGNGEGDVVAGWRADAARLRGVLAGGR